MKLVKDWENDKIQVEFERKEFEGLYVSLIGPKKLSEVNEDLWIRLTDNIFTMAVGLPIDEHEGGTL